ncbi:MAG: RecBCD enzyme subunit RecB [Chlamydiales bacterium]|nr:RecBCD enzyme subunit RecB [Chlamydiales bacterium]
MRGFDILDPTLDLKKNLFLEASAGTGKTFTIENCVIRLIEEGLSIDQILVVTFTRAATIELKTRIRAHLEKKNLRQALVGFDESKIFTIHGFCFHTLKEYALETGFALNQTEQSASFNTMRSIFKDYLFSELTAAVVHPTQLQKVLGKMQNDSERVFKALAQPPKIVRMS